jgi:hypothetical protein
VKKPPLPKAGKPELMAEALKLLSGRKCPEEAVEWLLHRFTGWDLEAIITELRNEAAGRN